MSEQPGAIGADSSNRPGATMDGKPADEGEDIPYRPLRPTSIDFKAEPADRKVVSDFYRGYPPFLREITRAISCGKRYIGFPIYTSMT